VLDVAAPRSPRSPGVTLPVRPRRRPARLVSYLIVVHLVFALLVGTILWAPHVLTSNRWWVLGAEVVLIVSLVVGARLLRALMAPLDTLVQGAHLLHEGDLTTRLLPVGQPEVDALVGVYNGMADRLREERSRGQERHHLLTQLLVASPSGVVFLDLQGRVDYANPAALRWLGPASAGAVGGTAAAANDSLLRESPLGRVLTQLSPEQVEVVALPGGGRLRCRRGSFMDRGAARTFFLIEELTDELRQAEKSAYEKLIRMMAHEVNNSMGAANSLLSSCLNYESLLPEEHREDYRMALQVVAKRTEQLSTLMRGFAEVIRLPSPQKVPCDVVALLEDVAVLMRSACAERQVQWRWDIQDRPPPIAMDRIQMEQVLVNVVKNALEAIGEADKNGSGGTITARVGRVGARTSVVIEDSGPGLSPEARQQLFIPFFTTKAQGQGIGLTLVQQILAQHRFEFALESPAGGPTRFSILM
jgi:two-component system, NtrC family, nitrogen regulation sensor histidine kinase NtrY